MPLTFARTPTFEFEFLRTVSHTRYGGADIGECFATADRIIDGDFDSWYDEWTRTADRVAQQAQHADRSGYPVSARDAWWRASNYYRAADWSANCAELGTSDAVRSGLRRNSRTNSLVPVIVSAR